MGRIRTRDIKDTARKLLERFPDRFTQDFELNKKILNEINLTNNKKMRNKIAGYLVRLVEQKKE